MMIFLSKMKLLMVKNWKILWICEFIEELMIIFFFLRETKKNYKNTMQEFISLRDRDKSFISLKIENNSVFDKSKNYNEEKKEEFISEFNYPNQENKSIKLIVYINEQIKLYANLAMTRNSLWKKHLENIFPIKLLFNQINNKKLLKGILKGIFIDNIYEKLNRNKISIYKLDSIIIY